MRSSPDIQRVARELRQNSTVAERLLWARLRGRRLAGFKFRRQHPMGRFVLDFYCVEVRLALELDGAQHQQLDRMQYDRTRSAVLARMRVRVLRLQNHDVTDDTDRVCDEIREVLYALCHSCGRGPGRGP